MGGAIFTLADFAFAVASNFQRSVTVAQAAQITYLAAAKGTVLFAEAREVRSGHSTCFFQADITDEFGTKVAFFTGNGFIIRQDTPKNPKCCENHTGMTHLLYLGRTCSLRFVCRGQRTLSLRKELQ
jgi:hypothetical protein